MRITRVNRIELMWAFVELMQKHIGNGELIEVLGDWCQPEEPLYLYYSSRQHLSAGFRAVVDALKGA